IHSENFIPSPQETYLEGGPPPNGINQAVFTLQVKGQYLDDQVTEIEYSLWCISRLKQVSSGENNAITVVTEHNIHLQGESSKGSYIRSTSQPRLCYDKRKRIRLPGAGGMIISPGKP